MVCNNLGLSLVTPIFFYMSRADLGVGLGGPAPAPPPSFSISGLLNISVLHVQYGIQTFAKFKRPECTRLHLRELQSRKFYRGACARNSLEKCAVRSPDRRYRAHIATVYYISSPLYHKILCPPLHVLHKTIGSLPVPFLGPA